MQELPETQPIIDIRLVHYVSLRVSISVLHLQCLRCVCLQAPPANPQPEVNAEIQALEKARDGMEQVG